MVKGILLFILIKSYCFICYGQEKLIDLKVNDELPDFNLKVDKDSVSENITKKDLKGKWVILDFFSSSCVICFRELPKLNELQKDFKDHLELVLIGKEDGKIKNVYEKFQKKYNLNLKVAFDSTIFYKWKIGSVPHYVWVDDNGIIQAITGPEELNSENILSFLNNQLQVKNQKRIDKINYDPDFYLLINDNGGADTNFMYRTVFSEWRPSMKTSFPNKINFVNKRSSFQVLGADLKTLYNYAYFGSFKWNSQDCLYSKAWNQPIVLVDDTYLFESDNKSGKNLFNYSLTVPPSKLNKNFLKQIMQWDLKAYFDFDVEIIKKKMPCWILTATTEALTELKTKSTETIRRSSYAGFSYSNVPISEIIFLLWINFQSFPPFIDETGIINNIDISLEAILTDFEEFKKGLFNNGLNLSVQEREFDVMIIKQPKLN